jgi:hypothetical protein
MTKDEIKNHYLTFNNITIAKESELGICFYCTSCICRAIRRDYREQRQIVVFAGARYDSSGEFILVYSSQVPEHEAQNDYQKNFYDFIHKNNSFNK